MHILSPVIKKCVYIEEGFFRLVFSGGGKRLIELHSHFFILFPKEYNEAVLYRLLKQE